MIKTLLPYSQAFAYYEYDRATKQLIVTTRKGWQYRYSPVPESDYNTLQKARNKGSHIVHHITKNPAYVCCKLSQVPEGTLAYLAGKNNSFTNYLTK